MSVISRNERAAAAAGASAHVFASEATCEPIDLTARVVITEEDVLEAARSHPRRAIVTSAGVIVTPLARDAIRRTGVELMIE